MLILLAAAIIAQVNPQCPPELDKYNLVWSTPSTPEQGAAGSVPIGNGLVGANVWVEEGGDLLFYISRTDAWSEGDRLLKLGRVRVKIEPNPFEKREPFRQELVLREGRIEWRAGDPTREVRLSLWVDADAPCIRIEGDATGAKEQARFTVSLESWRTERKDFTDAQELQSSWTMRDAPPEVRRQAWEAADVFDDNPALGTSVTWHHRNDHSIVPLTLKHQGLDSIDASFKDPLINRTFGGVMWCPGAQKTAPGTLAIEGPHLDLRIATHCEQTATLDEWIRSATQRVTPAAGPDGSKARSAAWWHEFWNRSWIFVDGDPPAPTHVIPQNKHPLRVGADSNGHNVFRGFISGLGIYNVPLSEAQVRPPRFDAPGTPLPWWEWIPKAGMWIRPRHAPPKITFSPIGNVREGSWAPEGEALMLEGGHYEIPSGELPDFSRGFTLVTTLSPSALAPARIIDKMTAGGADGFIFDTHPGDSLRLIVGDLTIQAPGVLKANSLQSAIATYDATTGHAAIYLDGKMVAEGGPEWSDPAPPSRITQAYVLQRWVQACGGRGGDFPIKFNGSIFTVEPRYTQGQPYNADWRKWGGCFWWQNTRLPYYPMLAAGDFDMMEPLFRFYENALPGCIARTKLYYGAQGVYFPETITTFGTYANGDYGWDRAGLASGDIAPCPWWQWAWNQSLELSQLMLDYVAYTGDREFLEKRALPMARQALLYFDSRFKRDEHGKLIISPTQAIETYWHGVVDDAPSVAGLNAVCDRLLALPPGIGSPEDRALWARMKAAAPDLPVREVGKQAAAGAAGSSKLAAAPAERYEDKRSNCETPELYPLFPFRLYGLGNPNRDRADLAYRLRVDRSTVGWTQDGIFAALLGLTDDAERNVLARVRNSHPNFRFPAMWGPNFDWLPDQDHGSNLMTTLQFMLLQADNPDASGAGTIRLIPAWPSSWRASFRLHAPGGTVVEGRVDHGKIVDVTVTPESRRKDLLIGAQK